MNKKSSSRVQIDDSGAIRLDGISVESMRLQDGTDRELSPQEAILVAKAIKDRYGPPKMRERIRIFCKEVKRTLTLSEQKTPVAFQFMCTIGAAISSLGGMLAVLPFIGHYVNVTAAAAKPIEPIFSPVGVIEFGFSAWLLGLLMQLWAKASDSAQSSKETKT